MGSAAKLKPVQSIVTGGCTGVYIAQDVARKEAVANRPRLRQSTIAFIQGSTVYS